MSKELLGESKISCWLKRKNLFPSLYYQKLFPSVNYPPTQTVQEKAGNKQRKILETEFSPSFLAVALSLFFLGGGCFFTIRFLVSMQWAFPSFCAHRREREYRRNVEFHCPIGKKMRQILIPYFISFRNNDNILSEKLRFHIPPFNYIILILK